ncbi:hypothetical protein Barb7_02293 [Bacteroidales bacterium Barb7]|nr:hypothetical protein Barb7_02293 [Bacteroidales bacterium Barb7]
MLAQPSSMVCRLGVPSTGITPMPTMEAGNFTVCRLGVKAKQQLPREARAWCRLKSMTPIFVFQKAFSPIAATELPCVKSNDSISELSKALSPI